MDDLLGELPDPQRALWQRYTDAERSGMRSAALAALQAFIDSMGDLDEAERTRWALSTARGLPPAGSAPPAPVPLRVPLWRNVVFPALRGRLDAGDPEAARLLVEHWQLTLTTPGCLAQLPASLRGTEPLLELALAADPSDARSRDLLIEDLAERLAFSIHEVPAGVLSGMDGATVEECRELEVLLERFEVLVAGTDDPDRFDHLISSCRYHFRSYADYLANRDRFPSYAEFLATGT